MFYVEEDSRNELKAKLNDKLEKEVVAFLNTNGGNIYIGVNDDGGVVGIDDNIDKLQLEIKDRIKNNIMPSTLGLFDIEMLKYDNKNILHIIVASGSEKPYYLKEKGMIFDGCYLRIGSSVEHMQNDIIVNMFKSRTRNSLRNIVSPTQNLTFSQLKIYYEENGYPINDNFLKQLNLINDDGKYNYIAYLLADNNSISIKVATYSGVDSYDLIENEEFGYCSIIKATKNIINKFKIWNKTFTKITSAERKEQKMVDEVSLREAIINAIVHNAWENEYPPKFEIFSDHISISSSGGLAENFTKQDFLKGFSAPKHPELMRVFKDLDMVEQLGTGIIRILKVYDESIYEFYPNFIRVNFEYNDNFNDIKAVNEPTKFSEIQKQIIILIKQNKFITQKELEDILGVSRSTIARQIKFLIDNNYLERIGANKNGYWKITTD